MSAWNPIDGWISSKPSKMEVLARVGPITIDDYLIVSDNVRNILFEFNIKFFKHFYMFYKYAISYNNSSFCFRMKQKIST